MDDVTLMGVVAIVVGAAFVCGFAFGAATFAAKVDAALRVSSKLDGELAAVVSAQLATNRAATDSLPVLNAAASIQDAPGSALEGTVHPTASAANDALSAPQHETRNRKPPLFGSGTLLGRAAAPKRPCSFCDRIRSFFSR